MVVQFIPVEVATIVVARAIPNVSFEHQCMDINLSAPTFAVTKHDPFIAIGIQCGDDASSFVPRKISVRSVTGNANGKNSPVFRNAVPRETWD